MDHQKYREYQKRLDEVSSIPEAARIGEDLGREATDTRQEALRDQLMQVLVEKGLLQPA